jgi:acyl-CoA thioester hydrolase
VPQADRVVTPLEGRPSPPWDPTAPIAAPLALHRCTVPAAWVDYNAHMSESCYLLVVGDSADAFFRLLGIDEAYRADGRSVYTAETHLHHRREVSEGEPLALTLQLLDHDDKRMHVHHEVRHGDTGALLAEAGQLLVHVDVREGRSTPMPPALLERVVAVRAAHADLPRPAVAGRPLQIRRPGSAS